MLPGIIPGFERVKSGLFPYFYLLKSGIILKLNAS